MRLDLFIYFIFFIIFFCCLTLYLFAKQLKLEKIELGTKNGLTFVQLSDIHIINMHVNKNKIKKIILDHSPDFICLTGDYIEHPLDIDKFISFIKYINPNNLPIYASNGNHDYKAFLNKDATEITKDTFDKLAFEKYLKTLKENNINLLNNKQAVFNKDNRSIIIIGLDEYRYLQYNFDKAFDNYTASPYIVLFHNPDLVYELSEYIKSNNIQHPIVSLCGHFHGGQIWLPFNLEYKILRKEKLCKIGITKGLHNVNDINIYINRGLGCVLFPFRFLSTPEITIFKI